MTNKYIYLLVVQGAFGQGWEDMCEYPDELPGGPDTETYGGDRTSARHDLKEYRLSGVGSYRLIRRRQLRGEPDLEQVKPELLYRVFHRTWWKDNPSWEQGLEPCPGKRHMIARHLSEAQARQLCQDWCDSHKPGRYSDKAEYEAEA